MRRFGVPMPPNDIHRSRFRARFQHDTQSTMKRAPGVSAVGVMRVKSQPAAMEWRRPVLIRFPGNIAAEILYNGAFYARANSPMNRARAVRIFSEAAIGL